VSLIISCRQQREPSRFVSRTGTPTNAPGTSNPPPLLSAFSDPNPTIESSYTAWIANNKQTIAEMKRLEEENNRLIIDAYGL